MKRSRRIFLRERFFLSAGRTLSRSCIEKADTHTTRGRNMCIENADTRTPEGLGRIFRAVMVLLPRFVRRGSERRRRGTIPRTPCVSMGKIGKKKIGASERRHNFFFRSRDVKKSEKVLASALFFFVRIAVKEMRQGSAGHSRGVSFPKSINKHKELVHPQQEINYEKLYHSRGVSRRRCRVCQR